MPEAKETISQEQIAKLIQDDIETLDSRLKALDDAIKPLSETLDALDKIGAQGKFEGEFEDLSPWLSHNEVNHLEQIELINSKKGKVQVDLGSLLLKLKHQRSEIVEFKKTPKPTKKEALAAWEKDLNILLANESEVRTAIKKEIHGGIDNVDGVKVKGTIQVEFDTLDAMRKMVIQDKAHLAKIKELENQESTPAIKEQIQALRDEITSHAQQRVIYDLEVNRNLLLKSSDTLSRVKDTYVTDLTTIGIAKEKIGKNKTQIGKLENEIKGLQRNFLRLCQETETELLTITDMVRIKLDENKKEELDENGIPIAPDFDSAGPPAPPSGPPSEPTKAQGYVPPNTVVDSDKAAQEDQKPPRIQLTFGENPQGKLRPVAVVKKQEESKVTEVDKARAGLGKKQGQKQPMDASKKKTKDKDIELALSSFVTKQAAEKNLIKLLEEKANELKTEQAKQPIYQQILAIQKQSIDALESFVREYKLQLEEVEAKKAEFLKIKEKLEPASEEPQAPPPPPPPPLDLTQALMNSVMKPESPKDATQPQAQNNKPGRLDAATTAQAFGKGSELQIRAFLAAQAIKIINQKEMDNDSDFQKKLVELLPDLLQSTAGSAFESIKNSLEATPLEKMSEKQKRDLMLNMNQILNKHAKYTELMEFTGVAKSEEEERQALIEEERVKRVNKIQQELKNEQLQQARQKLDQKFKQILTLNPTVNAEEVKLAESELARAAVANPNIETFANNLNENRKKLDLIMNGLSPEFLESINKVVELNQPAPPPPLTEGPEDAPKSTGKLEAAVSPLKGRLGGSASTPHLPASTSFFAHPGTSSALAKNSTEKDRRDWFDEYTRGFGSKSLENVILELGEQLLKKEDEPARKLLYTIAMKSRSAKDDYIKNGNPVEFIKHLDGVIKLIAASIPASKNESGFFAWIKKFLQSIKDAVTGKTALNAKIQENVLSKLIEEHAMLSGSPNPNNSEEEVTSAPNTPRV